MNTGTPSARRQPVAASILKHTLLLCALAALFTAIIPFTRAFLHLEINYNEGWNVYNAQRVMHHQLLYPARYAWTTVNYPILSFYLMSWLHRLTHDFLFTARIVSLLSTTAVGALAGFVIRAVGGSQRAAIIGALFTFAVFCANAEFYVGMDDPQLLANALFLLGFLIYLRHRRSLIGLCIAALVFVVAGCIKQSPIDFPLAALADLALLSLPLTLWLALCVAVFAAIAVALNIHFGGSFFVAELLTPRSYSALHILETFRDAFAVIPILFLFAVCVAWRLRKHPLQRTISLLFAVSLLVGGFFSGGSGVGINALFSAMIAMSLILGLACDDAPALRSRWYTTRLAAYTPLFLFAWLVIPMVLSSNIDPIRKIRVLLGEQTRFQQDVALLASHPGPVLCESLLQCYAAGKPYVYDPFNATRLIALGKLNDQVIVHQLQQHQFAFVQLDGLTNEHVAYPERFDTAIFDAIVKNYTPVVDRKDEIIYIPRTAPVTAAQPAA